MLRYPGGKSKLKVPIIKKINELIVDASLYIEPFFGGGSIGLNFLPNSKVKEILINDKSISVAAFWSAVIRHSEQLIELVQNYQPKVEDFFNIKQELLSLKQVPNDKIVDIGFKQLVIRQISYSGLGVMSGSPLGGIKQQSKYKIDCRWSPKHIEQKITKYHSLLNKFDIISKCCSSNEFQEIFLALKFDYENRNEEDCFYYLDPPYYKKGNELYQNGFHPLEHKMLSDLLRSTESKWLLSYDDCEEIRELYSWAKIEEIDANYTINTKNGSRKKKELLIYKE